MVNDNYIHYDDQVFYIVENILGPPEQSLEYEKLAKDIHSQLYCHCSCSKDCCLPTCKCLIKSSGPNYIKEDKYTTFIFNNAKSSPIFECNKYCLCSSDCSNRVVQSGPIQCLEIKHCDKGLGLFTSCFIPKGTFICEYAGELITSSQATKRHEKNLVDGAMNYIFCLKEHSDNVIVQTFVDPSVFGNIGRYMNHSCDPNCHIVPVRCDSIIPKLAIFTLKDVLSLTELTFHYGCDNRDLEPTHRIKCLCKSKNCCGVIPFAMY